MVCCLEVRKQVLCGTIPHNHVMCVQMSSPTTITHKTWLHLLAQVAEIMPLQSKLGGLATLQSAMCFDTLGAAKQAEALYRRVRGHPTTEVAKKVCCDVRIARWHNSCPSSPSAVPQFARICPSESITKVSDQSVTFVLHRHAIWCTGSLPPSFCVLTGSLTRWTKRRSTNISGGWWFAATVQARSVRLCEKAFRHKRVTA